MPAIPEPAHRSIVSADVPTAAWTYGPQDAPHGILLVHGFRGDHHGLALIASALVRDIPDFRVVVPDLPGFGATPDLPGGNTIEHYAHWLIAFAKAVRTEFVLGHSFGSIVVAAAISEGLSTHRLVLINPITQPALEGPQRFGTRAAIAYYTTAAHLPDRAARALLSNGLIVRGMSEIMAKTRNPALRAWIHRQHAQYFSAFSSPRGLLEAFRASSEHNVSDYETELTLPTLVLAGGKDDIVPIGHQREFVLELSDAQLIEYPECGHLIHYEAAEPAAHAIARFLAPELETTH